METIIISGANRGIGLSLTKTYLEHGHRVIATARDIAKAEDLQVLQKKFSDDQLILETVDIEKEDSIKGLWGRLARFEINTLINNAGVMSEYDKGLTEMSFDDLMWTLRINTIGPMLMVKYGLERLAPKAKIINVSSKVGSIADNASGMAYAYRMSKTALNMFSRNLSIEYPKNITIALHPGWVKTRMGGEAAPTSTAESGAGIFAVIQSLKASDNGKFLDFRGQEIPW